MLSLSNLALCDAAALHVLRVLGLGLVQHPGRRRHRLSATLTPRGAALVAGPRRLQHRSGRGPGAGASPA